MRLKKRGRGTAVFMAAAMAACFLSGCSGSAEKPETGNKQMEVNLNALIVLPEADNMSEVKVKEVSNDEVTKKRIVESIFDDKVHAYDIERLPQDVLKKYRKVSEQSLAYLD